MYPVYKGTFDRISDLPGDRRVWVNSSHRYTEYLTMVIKDFSRSIDYLETRPDIDSEKLAYFGFSWGGFMGAIIPAVEPRLKVCVLNAGGFYKNSRALPESDVINYVSRVTIPVLMLNGKYDMIFPFETSVMPMYDLLATPKRDKALKLYETDHLAPKNEVIKETLNWFDRYLGPVK